MRIPPTATFVKHLLDSKIPGKQRMLLIVAHFFQPLQLVPMPLANGKTLYLDMRVGDSHGLLIHPHELDEQAVMSHLVKEGDVAVDIGAHLGTHTVLLACLVGPGGHVHSFEPNPDVLLPLSQTVRRLPNASLHPFALSDQAMMTELFVPAHASMASLKNWTGDTDGKPRKIGCQTERLDDLIESGAVREPDFIKCDVEGAELQVFRGALDCLNRVDAPIILFEVNVNTARGFGLSTTSTMEYLNGLDLPAYHFFKVKSGGNLMRVSEPDALHCNIVAIPTSKMSRIT